MIDTKNKYLIPLEENAIIWRYLDFKKFESLINEKSLFFCRADFLGDKFEGSIPEKEADYLTKTTNDEIRKGYKEIFKEFRPSSMVCCWHIADDESQLMWNSYSSEKGVAIKSTKERLFNSLISCKETIWPTKVRYINYLKDTWYGNDFPTSFSFILPLNHKRIEFKSEKEFRLIIHKGEIVRNKDFWENQPNKKGILVVVDLNILIEKVVLNPNIESELESRIRKLGLNVGITIEKSNLSNEPLY